MRGIESFKYTANPGRIIFARGARRRIAEEARELGVKRVLVLCSAQQAEIAAEVVADLGALAVGLFSQAAMHTPVEVTEQAMARVRDLQVDGIVAVGGGSAIGLGKAIALRTDLPQIVLPTTYAGSEVTPIVGETRDGAKSTQASPRVLPEVVIYDVELTLGLPVPFSVTSAMNAIAHAVEALYARERNPVISLLAIEGVQALAQALPIIAADPQNIEGRSAAQYGAWLCGTCLGSVGMALHHKLCHTLGGSFNLPHAETHTIVLPHALAYNAAAAPEATAGLSRALGTDDPARALFDLSGALGAPRALRDLGMPENAIDAAADRAMANPYWNPRPLERAAIRDLIAAAWMGAAPTRSSLS
jgi:alcohol dehydrogenase class IV